MPSTKEPKAAMPIHMLPQNYFQKIAQSHDTIDKVEQSITSTLQQIDKIFSDCHKSAMRFYQELAHYHFIQIETNQGLAKWGQFFKSFDPEFSQQALPQLLFPSLSTAPTMPGSPDSVTFQRDEPSTSLSSPFAPMTPGIHSTPAARKTLLYHYLQKTPKASLSADHSPHSLSLKANGEFREGKGPHWTPSSAAESTPTLPSSNELMHHRRDDWDKESRTPHSDLHSFSDGASWILESTKRLEKLDLKNEAHKTSDFEDSDHSFLITPTFKSRLTEASSDVLASQPQRSHVEITKKPLSTLQEDSDEDNGRPNFSLGLFPLIFQSGIGAEQIDALYRLFSRSQDQSFTLGMLNAQFPTWGESCIKLLLDMLVRKKLIRQAKDGKRTFWHY